MGRFKLLFMLGIVFSLAISITAQVNIEKTDKHIIVLGKKYFLHEVKKGHTLYSISRAYGVSEHEIIAENADLVHGLKEGTEIKIPAKEQVSVGSDLKKDDYILHKVERKQTLYFLSRHYHVSEAEIIKLNPEINQGLKTGQMVKIPKPGAVVPDPSSGIVLHNVQPGETLFSISQRYGIEISSLIVENPELNEQGPKIGQVLRIPVVKKSFEDVLKVTRPEISVTTGSNQDPLYFEEMGITPCNEFKYTTDFKFKIAVLLPFFIQENYTTRNSGEYYRFGGISTGRFYEFYQGLLLASKNLRDAGISVEFVVKDTKASPAVTRQILSDSKLKEMDLIIGPVYSENFKLASNFAKENKINIVAPFKQKYEELVVNNPYIFLANPSDETEIGNIARYLTKLYDKSIVLIHNGTAEELRMAEIIKGKLVSSFSGAGNVNEIVYKQVNFQSGSQALLEDALSIGLENIVIVPSRDVVFITNVATKLNFLTKRFKIMVFGLSPWEQMESVEMEYIQNLGFHYGTTSFVDKNDEKAKLFDYQYKEYYKNEPTTFSYLGYDIAWYFLNTLKEYGKHFQFCLGSNPKNSYKDGLRFDFNFERVSPFSGYENNWLRIVKIDRELHQIRVQ